MKITTSAQLREIYGFPSGRAKDKVLKELELHSINFIDNSPLVAIFNNRQQRLYGCIS